MIFLAIPFYSISPHLFCSCGQLINTRLTHNTIFYEILYLTCLCSTLTLFHSLFSLLFFFYMTYTIDRFDGVIVTRTWFCYTRSIVTFLIHNVYPTKSPECLRAQSYVTVKLEVCGGETPKNIVPNQCWWDLKPKSKPIVITQAKSDDMTIIIYDELFLGLSSQK